MANIFHEGELAVQDMAGEAAMAKRNGAAIGTRIMRGALPFLEKQSLAVMAYSDPGRHVWASILFGRPGFVRSSDGLNVEIDLTGVAPQPYDPLWGSIGSGIPAGMLAIELASRRRIRINGELSQPDVDSLRLMVHESFANCPKYITRRDVRLVQTAALPLQSFVEGTEMGAEQFETARAADVLFIGTIHSTRGLDASHRGGAPGFIEVVDSRTLRIPDYLGNSMFNTLGNLAVDARAGIAIPDFARGKVLRLSGTAEALWNQPDDSNRSGGTHRFLQFHIECWNEEAFPAGLHAEFLDYSPYNPLVARPAAD